MKRHAGLSPSVKVLVLALALCICGACSNCSTSVRPSDRELAEVYADLGRLQLQTNNIEEAVRAIHMSLVLDPDNTDVRILYDQITAKYGQTGEALHGK